MMRKTESVSDLCGSSGRNERKIIGRSPFSTSPFRTFKDFSGNANKAVKKSDPDYEEIGPQSFLRNQNNKDARKNKNCDLCGSVEAAVKCDLCKNQSFCLSCDDMYHRHPKRSSHVRKAVDNRPFDRAPLKPPLPPKVIENSLSPPPQPPPRRNKRSGMINSFGKIDQGSRGRMRRSSVGGELLCTRTSQQVLAPNGLDEKKPTSTSVVPYMTNRPLPPTPNNNRGFIPKVDSVGNANQRNCPQYNQHPGNPHSQVSVTAPSGAQAFSNPQKPMIPIGFTPYPPVNQNVGPPRKLSLQQFPPGVEERKASFIEPTPGTVAWENQPPQIPQKMRSQSISDDQWRRTVLEPSQEDFPGRGTASAIGEVHMHQGYNSMGYGGRPYVPIKGMTSSASVSNINALHGRTNSFQQMNMLPYDPNMMWMTCPQCNPQHGYHQSSISNRGMKRAASNISMNMSSVTNDTSGYPWAMPIHVNPHMPFHPGYYPNCQQHMPQHMPARGSATSIPDSMQSIGKGYFSQAGSDRLGRGSQKQTKSFNNMAREGRRSRYHSRPQSIDSNETTSSLDSDENLHDMRTKPNNGCLSWQCHHCTFINPGHTEICSMCSKPYLIKDDRSFNRNDRRRKSKRYYKGNSKENSESRLSDYDNITRSFRDYRDQRTRLPSSTRSLRTNNKNMSKSSFGSDSPSLSDSPFEDEQRKVENQLKLLNLSNIGRAAVHKGSVANFGQRERDKQRKPEGKHKFRNRSQSASVRRKASETLPARLSFSINSSDSDDDRKLQSEGDSPDELEEKRISSLEETIMASIMLNQQNKINAKLSKERTEFSGEDKTNVSKMEDLYSTVSKKNGTTTTKTNLANAEKQRVMSNPMKTPGKDYMTNPIMHDDLINKHIINLENISTISMNHVGVGDNETISKQEFRKSLSSEKDFPSLSIEIDDPIDYIDASSDNECMKAKEIWTTLKKSSDKLDTGLESDESSSITPKVDVNSKSHEQDTDVENVKSPQLEIIKLSAKLEKEIDTKVQENISPVAQGTYRLSPISVSSSDVQYYSPPVSPVESLEGKYFEMIDKGFETDIYADEDLVTALESLESTEEVSSEGTIHSSLEQLSFTDEIFDKPENEISDTLNSYSTNRKESKGAILTKSISDHAISAKMQIQISPKVNDDKPRNNSQTVNRTLSVKEIVEQNLQQKMKQDGFQIVKYFREAEQKGYNPKDVSIAMSLCDEGNPVEWLDENWNAMIDTVQTLATNYGVDREPNDVGKISSSEAKDSLRVHKGNIWAAVTECVEQRQEKYKEIYGRGSFSSHDIVIALEVAGGNVAEAIIGLAKANPIGKLIKKIWNSSVGVETLNTYNGNQIEVNGKSETDNVVLNETEGQHKQIINDASFSNVQNLTSTHNKGIMNQKISERPIGVAETKCKIPDAIQSHDTHNNKEGESSQEADSESENEDYISTMDDLPNMKEDAQNFEASSRPTGINQAQSIHSSNQISGRNCNSMKSRDSKKNSISDEKQIQKCDSRIIKSIICDTSEFPSNTLINQKSIRKEKSKSVRDQWSDEELKIKTMEPVDHNGSVTGLRSKLISEEILKSSIKDCPLSANVTKSCLNLTSEVVVDMSSEELKPKDNPLEDKSSSAGGQIKHVQSEDYPTEEKDLITDPIIVDGDKVREHGGLVTVQKATKIVALAITKAMARESAVKDDTVDEAVNEDTIAVPKEDNFGSSEVLMTTSGRTSSASEPEKQPSPQTSNTEKESDEAADETPEVTNTNEIPDENLITNNSQPIIKKGSVPPAVESFVGPIFIPTKKPEKPSVKKKQRSKTSQISDKKKILKKSAESAVRNRIKEIEISSHHTTAVANKSILPITENFDEIENSNINVAGTSRARNSNKSAQQSMESSSDSDTENHKMTINISENDQLKQIFENSSPTRNSPNDNSSTSNSSSGNSPTRKSPIDNYPMCSSHIGNSPIVDFPSGSINPASPTDKVSTLNVNNRNKHISGGSTMESSELSENDTEDENELERIIEPSDDVSKEAQITVDLNKESIQSIKPNEFSSSDELSIENPIITVESPTNEENGSVELSREQKSEQLHFDRTVRRLLAEGHAPTYEKAELAAHLLALSFDEEDSVSAAIECASIYSAMRFLRQECELCAERYSMGKMVSMLHCVHRCCYQCAKNYFTFQIKTKNIRELRCPFCNEPDLEADEEVTMEYLNNLDILLKGIIDTETHELFQRKVRDLTLMKDPNFRWCNKCSSGYIANARARKLICPDCKEVTCAQCRQVWELQHEGITCEEFLNWKTDNDPESQAKGVARHLAENGITCPKCRFTYALAKGGCMHFTCSDCKFEFCSGCSQPFKQGAKCTVGPYCERLGLHAHHPRNCLFYLRDKDPEQLQQLLAEHKITFDTETQYDKVKNSKPTCRVLEQKETLSGLKDDACGRAVLNGHAGLCKQHYSEYLSELVRYNSIDPVDSLDADDLRYLLRRENIPTIKRYSREDIECFRQRLIKLIKEQLPLDSTN